MLAAAGFEIVAADFAGRLYGAYTCVKARGRDDGRFTQRDATAVTRENSSS